MKGVKDFKFVDLEKVSHQDNEITFNTKQTNNYPWILNSNCEIKDKEKNVNDEKEKKAVNKIDKENKLVKLDKHSANTFQVKEIHTQYTIIDDYF